MRYLQFSVARLTWILKRANAVQHTRTPLRILIPFRIPTIVEMTMPLINLSVLKLLDLCLIAFKALQLFKQ